MQSRTRIKMCGVTSIEDAKMAVVAGVDALGFIFAESSPRVMTPDRVKEVVAQMPPFVDLVGVFVNQNPVEIVEITEYCGLTHVQLHGDEDAEYCRELAYEATPCRIIKAFRVRPETKASDFAPYQDAVSAYLLDTYRESMAGGTGMAFDWQQIESFQLQRPFILAGGLRAENIAEAIRLSRPFAVDVNSGVEDEPRRKNQEKLAACIEQVRFADGWPL